MNVSLSFVGIQICDFNSNVVFNADLKPSVWEKYAFVSLCNILGAEF